MEIFKFYTDIQEGWKKKGKKFPIFQGTSWIETYIYNYILERHKNDCAYDIPNYFNNIRLIIGRKWGKGRYNKAMENKTYKEAVEKYNLDVNNQFLGGFDFKWIQNNGFEKLIDKFLKCKKKNLILAIPLNIGSDGKHANLILINPFTNTFERYEPHGEKTGGVELDMKGYDSEYYDTILRKLVEIMNTHKDINLKYYTPADTCPTTPKGLKTKQPFKNFTKEELKKEFETQKEEIRFKKKKEKGLMVERAYLDPFGNIGYSNKRTNYKFVIFKEDLDKLYKNVGKNFYQIQRKGKKETIKKGFQSLQATEGGSDTAEEAFFDSIVYQETGGYCAMWSFFYMDVRLNFPKEEPAKTLTRALKMLKGENNKNSLLDFIRGFTDEIMDDLDKNLGDFYKKFVRGFYGRKSEDKKKILDELKDRVNKIVNVKYDEKRERLEL